MPNLVTYEELVALRNNGLLVPEKSYRIIDYQATTTQEDTRALNHKFDIIVRALDENHLYEKVRICQHDGEEYFNDIVLDAWKVQYCIDNDINRFKWADPENGKGVIYHMIDEFNNECFYDFVNIQFKKSIKWFKERPNWCNSVLGYEPVEDMYFYTFSWVPKNGEIKDMAIIGHTMENETGGITGVYNNKIETCNDRSSGSMFELGYNIFIATEYWQDDSFYGLYSNNLKANCRHNTFGNECHGNILYSKCSYNTFGNYCQFNKLMANCHHNTFKSSSFSNTLGYNCSEIVLNDSTYNTFGPECKDIIACLSMHCNTFGTYCQHINCGDKSNRPAGVIKFNIFENNVRCVDLMASKAFSSGSLQNVTICQGVQGSIHKPLKVIINVVNQDYQLKVGKDMSGELKIYCEAELLNKK